MKRIAFHTRRSIKGSKGPRYKKLENFQVFHLARVMQRLASSGDLLPLWSET
jgi:hypothetical protein